MHAALLRLLVDPHDGGPLELEAAQTGEIVRGELSGQSGARYPISGGIPRFVVVGDPGQLQTQGSFGYKWNNRNGFGSEGMQRVVADWVRERYGFQSIADMTSYFGSRHRILDAGCGAGLAASSWMTPTWTDGSAEYVGVDISSAIDVAQERLGKNPGTTFVQADILALPFAPGSFDTIFSEGVLHHTPSTERAFEALVPLLDEGGELMIYVYRKKAPLREFTDDYIRSLISSRTPDEAWDDLRPLTRLAHALSDLHVEVDVPEDVPLLGIPAGRHNVQRLIYWYVAKLYWNDELTFEENNHLNYDWYHPTYAHRHTEEEVRGWFEAGGLEITRFDSQEAGFTVRGIKRRASTT